jgi:hypothetical protein
MELYWACFQLIYQIQQRSRCAIHTTGTYLGYMSEDKYTRLRTALRSKYLNNAARNGEAFSNSCVLMSLSDLKYIAHRKLVEGQYDLRCFYILDYQGMERVTESTNMCRNKLQTVHRDKPHAKCLALEWLRPKQVQQIR